MKPQTINYHYTESGLPNVWIECMCVKDDAGDDTVIIPNIGRLHKAIAREIVLSDGALSGAEIKFLRSMMGLTPEAFGDLMHRAPATVARWERGDAAPSALADAFIRLLAADQLLDFRPDAADISGKWRAVERKRKIRIPQMPSNDRGGVYRLAA